MIQKFLPDQRLKHCIKSYFVYESSSDVSFDDVVFASGFPEIIFNLGQGSWQTAGENGFVTNPIIEFWGQVTQPLPIRSVGKNCMLGIRFLPHGAAWLLNDKASLFNNQVVDFAAVAHRSIMQLHEQLLNTLSWPERIKIMEGYLLKCLSVSEKGVDKTAMIQAIMNEIKQEDFFDNMENVASRYGITARHLQKLFLNYTGLTPKFFSKINRFQKSLQLVSKEGSTLTAIAYDCGYFDQSHFIREFKSFTGYTPSSFAIESSPMTVAFSNI